MALDQVGDFPAGKRHAAALKSGAHHFARAAQGELALDALRGRDDKTERVWVGCDVIVAKVQAADDRALRIVDRHGRADT